MKTRISKTQLLAVATAVLILVLLPEVVKAIYVTPHAVFINHGSRAGQVTVGNSGDTAEEVTIELKFGFPDTDSAGIPFVRFVDDPGSVFPSASDWIRPYPRLLRLEPGDQQVVRLLATPADDLPDGEYWTRMIVTARGASLPIESADTAVRAGVSLEIRLITAITYRKGDVRTGIELRDLTASVEGDSLIVWLNAAREGNAAYLGTAGIEVLDQERTAVREWFIPMAVYYPINRRFTLPLQSLASGTYLLRFTLEAERSDLAADNVLPAPTVSDSIEIRIP